MSRIIKITPDCLDEIRKEFEETLGKAKAADGKISFTKTLSYISRKAVVYFSEVAWLKMQSLIREFDKEVAWHGVATRGEDENKDEYYISDILVYPQTVSGASVEMDTDEYDKWIRENDEDERMYKLRMQGHSHVNMGVSPSSVDLKHYEDIFACIPDDDFYIFMIWNKKGEKTIKIYDLAKNIFFDSTDVSVEIMDGDLGLDKFIKDAKDMVKDKVHTPSANNGGYTGYGGYNGYDGYIGDTRPATGTTTKTNNKGNQNDKGFSKKKGKRKGKGGGHQMTVYGGYDDMDDPYGYW